MMLRFLVSPQERRHRKNLIVELADNLKERFSSGCSAEGDGDSLGHGAIVAYGSFGYTCEGHVTDIDEFTIDVQSERFSPAFVLGNVGAVATGLANLDR